MKKVIWQPELYGSHDFGVNLDKDFAKEMINSHISSERQDQMNKLANDELKRLGDSWKNPYSFHEDTCFVKQIYIGNNGVWLSTDRGSINALLEDRLQEPLEYHSHEVHSSKDAYILLRLFGKWVGYSDAFKKE